MSLYIAPLFIECLSNGKTIPTKMQKMKKGKSMRFKRKGKQGFEDLKHLSWNPVFSYTKYKRKKVEKTFLTLFLKFSWKAYDGVNTETCGRNIQAFRLRKPFPWVVRRKVFLSFPADKNSCILSGQSEFNLRAKSSTSLHQKVTNKWKI